MTARIKTKIAAGVAALAAAAAMGVATAAPAAAGGCAGTNPSWGWGEVCDTGSAYRLRVDDRATDGSCVSIAHGNFSGSWTVVATSCGAVATAWIVENSIAGERADLYGVRVFRSVSYSTTCAGMWRPVRDKTFCQGL